MKSYDQVHAGLFWANGRASEHTCTCGAVARDWAYQHQGGSAELTDERGRKYSEDFGHYKPMCIPCHRRLDLPHRVKRLVPSPGQVESGRRLAASLTKEQLSAAGRAASRVPRRLCNECPLVTSPGGLATHQSFTGHSGWTTLERKVV